MYSIFAKFPRIESLDLYNMVEPFKLNVTDMINEVLLYGDISLENIEYINHICYKFGAVEITLKQQKEPV